MKPTPYVVGLCAYVCACVFGLCALHRPLDPFCVTAGVSPPA
jgi:hypothetical protein